MSVPPSHCTLRGQAPGLRDHRDLHHPPSCELVVRTLRTVEVPAAGDIVNVAEAGLHQARMQARVSARSAKRKRAHINARPRLLTR